MSEAVVNVLEAVYRVTLPEREWLEQTLQAFAPLLTQGSGTYGYLFDATGPNLRVGCFESIPKEAAIEQAMSAMVENVPREYIERSWLHTPAGYACDIAGTEEILAASGAPWRDILAINGFDPTGHGVWVGTPLVTRGTRDDVEMARFTRLAAHLAAAYRLRRRLAGLHDVTRGADAIAEPNGDIAHAEGPARESGAREALKRAVLAIDRARTRSGRAAPDQGLASWRGLVGARWSLVDHFDADGRRYVVARANQVHATEVPALSERERQVMALLTIGHSTKVTGYELGLSDTTVRVLLMRAIRKLGVNTREEAIAAFRKSEGPG